MTDGRSGATRVGALSAVGALLAAALAAPALAVDVEGTLDIPSSYADERGPEPAQGPYWDQWNGVLDPRPVAFDPGASMAVVLTGSGTPEEGSPTFRMQNGTFRPRTLVARVGSTIRIENVDPVTYELFSPSLSEFVATPTPPGNARQLAVGDAAGHHELRDRVYRHVRGHLHVLADLVARATVRPDGRFVFEDVPEGRYFLEVFHGERRVHRERVQVGARRDVEVDPIRIGRAR